MEPHTSKLAFSAWSNTELAGCTDLTTHDNEKWLALGGQDVVCWGNDVKIYCDSKEAAEYMVAHYGWECVEEIEVR